MESPPSGSRPSHTRLTDRSRPSHQPAVAYDTNCGTELQKVMDLIQSYHVGESKEGRLKGTGGASDEGKNLCCCDNAIFAQVMLYAPRLARQIKEGIPAGRSLFRSIH